MIRRTAATALLLSLFVAGTLHAQTPAGLKLRVDRSTNAADPDDVPDVGLVAAGTGFQVNTGPAAVVWNPANTADGSYTLKGTFTLQKPSSHTNYYGLIFGGHDLEAAEQRYYYFMVAQNGMFMVKAREGSATRELIGGTAHAAVVRPNAAGTSVNTLEVRVQPQQVAYLVNGTQVHTTPRSAMGAGVDGIWGVRVNHVIPGVLVEGLSVTE